MFPNRCRRSCSCCSRAKRTASMASEYHESTTPLEKWAAKQPLPIEAAVTTAIGALTGVVFGAVRETLCAVLTPSKLDSKELFRVGTYRLLIQSTVQGPRIKYARDYAVYFGVHSGICCAMKRLIGKDDVHSRMVAAFGSGVMVSLVTGMRGPDAVSVGALYALMSGGIFKVKEKLSQPKDKEVMVVKKRNMFSSISLGDDHYDMNFNKPLFTKNALSL